MRKNKKAWLWLLGLLLLVVSSCKNSKTPEERILKHQDGSIRRHYTLVEGKIDGEMLDFYPKTGAIQSRRQFIAGVQVGQTKLYYPDGKLKEVQYYQDGKKERGDTVFYPNGQPQFLITFKGGKMDGPMRRWTEDGALFFEAHYVQDSLKGVSKIMKAIPDEQ